MKRKMVGVSLMFCLALMLVSMSGESAAIASGNPAGVRMSIDGLNIGFGEQPPYIDSTSGRTMIPLRMVAESLGADVSWDNKDTAIINKKGLAISMKVGAKNPVVNGVTKYLDAPAVLVNGKVMVPVRFISEAMGCRVEWDQANKCVKVFTDGTVNTPALPVQPIPEVKKDNGLLLNEARIQKELTQEDIERLKSYPASEKPQKELKTLPASERVKFGKHYDTFNKDLIASVLQSLNIFQGLCNVDYTKFAASEYKEEYKKNYFSIGWKTPENDATVTQYINDSVKNGLKTKGCFLASESLVWQASPNYTAVRAKYIFYQESGTKIEEEGSTLGKWYWRDMEILFVHPFGTREGNTTGLIYSGYGNLSKPQPYVFK